MVWNAARPRASFELSIVTRLYRLVSTTLSIKTRVGTTPNREILSLERGRRASLPSWLCWGNEHDPLRLVRQSIKGMTCPQLYLKRRGVTETRRPVGIDFVGFYTDVSKGSLEFPQSSDLGNDRARVIERVSAKPPRRGVSHRSSNFGHPSTTTRIATANSFFPNSVGARRSGPAGTKKT